MDPGTISAIAALAVALIALLVALAQVAQQYVSTAVLMRKCDSIVFGPMRGGGKRVWFGRQLRFKVVYSMPRISIDAELWALNSADPAGYLDDSTIGKTLEPLDTRPKSTPLRRRFGRKLPNPEDLETPIHDSAEASWASFCRACQPSCGESLKYHMVSGEADRCPDDLPVIPMQVSFRDVIVMALRSGMRIVMSTDYTSSLTIQGKTGTITSAQHPILGLILHFTPRGSGEDFGLNIDKKVPQDWMTRLGGDCPVADRWWAERERRYEEGLMLSKVLRLPLPGEGVDGGDGGYQLFSDLPEMGVSPRDPFSAPKAEPKKYDEILRAVNDGPWTIEVPQALSENLPEGGKSKSPIPDTASRAGASKMSGGLATKDSPGVSSPEIPSNGMPESSQNQDTPTFGEKEAVHLNDRVMSSLEEASHIDGTATMKSENGDIEMQLQTKGKSKINQDQNAAAQSETAELPVDTELAIVSRPLSKSLKDMHEVDSDRLPNPNGKGNPVGVEMRRSSNFRSQEQKVGQQQKNLRGSSHPFNPPESGPGSPKVDHLQPHDAEKKQRARNSDRVTSSSARQNSFPTGGRKFPSTSASNRFDVISRDFIGEYAERNVRREYLKLKAAKYKQERIKIVAETAEQARLRKIEGLERYDAEITQRKKHREVVAKEQIETDKENFDRFGQGERIRLELRQELRKKDWEGNARFEAEKLLFDTQAMRCKAEEEDKLRKDEEEREKSIEPIYLTDPDGNRFKLPFRKFKRSTAMAVALFEWLPLRMYLNANKGGWYQLLGPDGQPIFPGAWSGVVEPGIEITLVYKDIPNPKGLDLRSWPLVSAGDPFDKDPETTSASDEEWLDRRTCELQSRSGSDSDSGDSSLDSDNRSHYSASPSEVRRVLADISRFEGVVVEEGGITKRTGSPGYRAAVREENSNRIMERLNAVGRSARAERVVIEETRRQVVGSTNDIDRSSDVEVVIEEHSPRRTVERAIVVGGSPRAEGVVVEERGITRRTENSPRPRVVRTRDIDRSSDDEVIVIEEHSPPRRRSSRRRSSRRRSSRRRSSERRPSRRRYQ